MAKKISNKNRSIGELAILAAKHPTHKPTQRRLKRAKGEYVQEIPYERYEYKLPWLS